MSIKNNRSLQRYILLLCLIRSTLCLTCPNLVDSTTDCKPSKQCDGEVCYRDPAAASTVLTGFCCNPKFCSDTNLESYADIDDNERYTFNAKDSKLWTTRNNESVNYTCPIPFSALFVKPDNVTLEEKYPYSNISQWREDGNVRVETCTSNANCAYLNDKDFAGYCFENKKPEKSSKVLKFCYKLKQLANSEYLLDPTANGPKFCSEHTDCASRHLQGLKYDAWYCHTTDRYMEGNGVASGICLRTRACRENEYATRPSVGKMCVENAPCNNTGVATPGLNPREQYEPVCTQLQVGNNPRLCCQKRLPSCEMGDTVIPRVTCETTADCNKDVMQNDFSFHNKWCSAEKTCCESKTDHNIVYCPDEATPLRFEKECEGYTIGQNDSGSCPNSVLNPDVVTSGICKLGHCCPGLIKSLGSNLPTHSFATNLLCDSSDKPPTRYIHAYCDKKTKHIVIAGVHGFDGKKVTKTSTSCKDNSDCKGDDNMCVFGENSSNFCYVVMTKIENYMKYVYGGGGIAVIILAVILFFCFRDKIFCQKKSKVVALTKVQKANIKSCLTRWYASLTMESLDKMVSSVSNIPNSNEPPRNKLADNGDNPVPVEPKTQVNVKLDGQECYHANWVIMPNKNKFIAAEAPLGELGIDRFFHMVFESDSKHILMFGDTWRKDNREVRRVSPYNGTGVNHGNYVLLDVSPRHKPVPFPTTQFKLTKSSNPSVYKIVSHRQFVEWDEYFAVATTDGTLKLYDEYKNKTDVVVHCHFGVGPTGVFLALIYIFQKIAQKTDATILQLIEEVRGMRRGAIQTQYQFLFLLQCIYEKAEKDGIIEHMPGMDLVKEKMKKMRETEKNK